MPRDILNDEANGDFSGRTLTNQLSRTSNIYGYEMSASFNATKMPLMASNFAYSNTTPYFASDRPHLANENRHLNSSIRRKDLLGE